MTITRLSAITNATPALQSPLSDQQFLYYSRQLLLPDWSEQRQLQLQQKKVLIVGMGGLGCPAATYLAGAGVGWLLLADGDKVEFSNLPRQTLFRQQDVGQNKAETAAATLRQLNPFVRIDALAQMLDEAELARRIAWADLVLDCSDNLATKLAINRLCQQQQRGWLGASASGYQGYSWWINPASGGCPARTMGTAMADHGNCCNASWDRPIRLAKCSFTERTVVDATSTTATPNGSCSKSTSTPSRPGATKR